MSFYRLRQTDMDGKIAYSPVRAVAGEKDKPELTQWPNPASGTFYIKINGTENAMTRIVDAAGREVRKFILKPFIPETVNGLPGGTYLLQVTVNENELLTKKFIIH